jgi:hypothetical protein
VAAHITPPPTETGRRLALVIGNDRYPNLPADKQLAKAVNIGSTRVVRVM